MLNSKAQTIESLQAELNKLAQNRGFEKDTAYLNKAVELGYLLVERNPDSSLLFLNNQLNLCKKAGYRRGEAQILKIFGNAWQMKGDFKASIKYYNQALSIAKAIGEDKIIPGILNNIGLVYANQGNYAEALSTYFAAIQGADRVNNSFVKGAVLNNIASIYFEQDKLDEAEENYRKALEIDSASGNIRRVVLSYNNIGDVKLKQKKPAEALRSLKKGYGIALELKSPDLIEMTSRTLAGIYVALDSLAIAEEFYRKSIEISRQNGYSVPCVQSLFGLAELLNNSGNQKEALGYALEGMAQAEKMGQTILLRNGNEVLSKIYESEGKSADALKSFKLFKQYNDSINNLHSQKVAATLEAEYEFSKKALQFEKESLRQKWLIFSAFAGLVSIAIILFILARSRNNLRNAFHKLKEKTLEIENKNEILEKTLGQLKSTQLQLIHAEKMASLGELTAGIAHEIQNPLNFVNNFSELNAEIIDEMETELKNGQYGELKDLFNILRTNAHKINQHGKRADAIVKGMLDHSRTETGQKVATDLNGLSKEYLRLVYQGLKTKDKDFESDYKFQPAPNLPKIEMIPQEIGRVLFNLVQNAFYAVWEKAKSSSAGYKPLVKLSVQPEGEMVKVLVEDNGNGVPPTILNKIFQPFFTTRPSGQGTGLGLSLSYDIVKAHGGELTVETKEGEGSIFIISLPALPVT